MAYEQFSSFQIGKMLNVSRQAVNQWIDKGYIHSYRTPGGHRRVRRDDLLTFLKTRNIPVPTVLQSFLEPGSSASGSAAPGAAELSGPSVMLVDDDRDYISLLVKALKDQFKDVNFQMFDNGFDALVAIGNNPPDVLTLDLKMPNINGLEICRRLKDNDLTREMSIVIVTAHDTPEWRDALAQLGIHNICPKSEAFDVIVNKLAQVVRAEIVA